MSADTGHRPLVVFTSVAIAGAGLVSASAFLAWKYRLVYPAVVATGATLLAAALCVSLSHLGQKRRAALAMRGAGRSPLSNEVLAAGLALASAAVAVVIGLSIAHARIAIAAAGVINALFLVSVGLVYRVRGQRTWQGFSALTPLTGGLAFGMIALQSLTPAGGIFRGTLLLVAIDALVFLQRWREVTAVTLQDVVLAEPRLARRDHLLGARFFLLDVVPAVLLVAWPTSLAVAVAAAGLVVDRIGFFALAIQHTTEHEFSAVEDRITNLDRPASR
jgi:DMSO reductase anchor subunit